MENFRISLKCLFCSSVLLNEEEKEYSSGDMVKCKKCGELNDFDSLIKVASEKGIEIVKDEIDKELGKFFKKK